MIFIVIAKRNEGIKLFRSRTYLRSETGRKVSSRKDRSCWFEGIASFDGSAIKDG